MKIITGFAFCFVLWFVHSVSAQEKISPNHAVTRNVEPGKSHIYSVSLQDGDYVDASITPSGRIDVIILDPDGATHGSQLARHTRRRLHRLARTSLMLLPFASSPMPTTLNDYSNRSAVIGSTRDARCADRQQAAMVGASIRADRTVQVERLTLLTRRL
jgi:hypothetical protein